MCTTLVSLNGKLIDIPVFEVFMSTEELDNHLDVLEAEYSKPQKRMLSHSYIHQELLITEEEVYKVGAAYCNATTNHVLNNSDVYCISCILYIQQDIPAYMRNNQRIDYNKPSFSPLYNKEITLDVVKYNMSLF